MGNSFSIFITSPQEHASQHWEKGYRRGSLLEKIPCRRGYIRCKFHMNYEKYHFENQQDMVEDIQLEPDGSLSLSRVKDIWGLHSIKPIDPARWYNFDPRHTNRLSNLAVAVLADVDDCIHFYEPTPPKDVTRLRSVRMLALTATKQVNDTLTAPYHYGISQAKNVARSRHCQRYMVFYSFLLYLALCIFAFLFVFVVIPGLHIPDRWRNLVRTGSFALPM